MKASIPSILLLLLVVILTTLSPVAAQSFTQSIPATATVVRAPLSGRANNQTYWICGGTTLTVAGNGNTIYAEPNVGLTINGNNNVVYSRSATAVQVIGNNNDVYAATRATCLVDGNNNTIHAPGAAQFSGNNNTQLGLGSLAFSYSTAPGNGCRTLATPAELTATAAVQLSPNPVGADRWLTINAPEPVRGGRVMDLTGRVVQMFPAGATGVSLRNVAPGLYVLETELTTGRASRRVLVP